MASLSKDIHDLQIEQVLRLLLRNRSTGAHSLYLFVESLYDKAGSRHEASDCVVMCDWVRERVRECECARLDCPFTTV